jgi:hypothetical protein
VNHPKDYYSHGARSSDVVIGQWNMLASNMAYGEFLSRDDERTFLPWELRQEKVVAVLSGMFKEGKCDFVVVIENDRPWEILTGLRTAIGSDMACVAVVEKSDIGGNTAACLGGNREARTIIKDIWNAQYKDPTITETALGQLQKGQFTTHDQYNATLDDARENM